MVTTLAQLRLRGPQDALDNPEDVRGYRHREEQRRTERDTQRERERQKQQEAESRREAAAWPCPTCGRKVYPDDDGETPLPGSDCTFCTSTKKPEQQETEALAAEEAAAREEAKKNGLFGFLDKPSPPKIHRKQFANQRYPSGPGLFPGPLLIYARAVAPRSLIRPVGRPGGVACFRQRNILNHLMQSGGRTSRATPTLQPARPASAGRWP
ncbi:hypothetical protein [Streptomyces microflavus]|uniref:hypothetical protein n=1 Tax=Streptomyces microflavus TaxID=1919 RepID=UPI00365946E4